MIVVADSSCFVYLGNVDKIFILKEIFGKVLIPKSVYQELTLSSKIPVLQKESFLKSLKENFVKVESVKEKHIFKRILGKGESEALELALECNADLIILDDKRAVKEAKELSLKFTSTSNILKLAEELQIINSYSEIINELAEMGIFIPK